MAEINLRRFEIHYLKHNRKMLLRIYDPGTTAKQYSEHEIDDYTCEVGHFSIRNDISPRFKIGGFASDVIFSGLGTDNVTVKIT